MRNCRNCIFRRQNCFIPARELAAGDCTSRRHLLPGQGFKVRSKKALPTRQWHPIWGRVSSATQPLRPRAILFAVHGFMAFMAINGTIVFETGPTRWVALAVCAVLAIVAVRGRRARRKSSVSSQYP